MIPLSWFALVTIAQVLALRAHVASLESSRAAAGTELAEGLKRQLATASSDAAARIKECVAAAPMGTVRVICAALRGAGWRKVSLACVPSAVRWW